MPRVTCSFCLRIAISPSTGYRAGIEVLEDNVGVVEHDGMDGVERSASRTTATAWSQGDPLGVPASQRLQGATSKPSPNIKRR